MAAYYCAPDGAHSINDISTITPDNSALGHQSQSMLNTSGLTSQEQTPAVDLRYGALGGGVIGSAHTIGQQAALYQAAVGSAAPPPPPAVQAPYGTMHAAAYAPPPTGAVQLAQSMLMQSAPQGTMLAAAAAPPPTGSVQLAQSMLMPPMSAPPPAAGVHAAHADAYSAAIAQSATGVHAAYADAYSTAVARSVQNMLPAASAMPVQAVDAITAYSAASHTSPGRAQRLQVYHEDCIFDVPLGLSQQSFKQHLPTSPSRALAASSKPAPIHREVYVQHHLDADRFKPVPVQRMKSAFQNAKPATASQRQSSRPLELWTSCVDADPDVMQLQTDDPVDVDILELLACSEECQTFAAQISLALQAVLAGLSFTAGLVAFNGAGGTSDLQRVLKMLEPGFSCVMLILAELLCVGNALRLIRAWDKVTTAKAGSIDQNGSVGDIRESAKRQVIHTAGISAVRLVTNVAFFLCCLVATRGNVILLYMDEEGQKWSGDSARNLLKAQSFLGVLALAFTASDLFDMMSLKRSVLPPLGASMLDDSRDDSRDPRSAGVWPQ